VKFFPKNLALIKYASIKYEVRLLFRRKYALIKTEFRLLFRGKYASIKVKALFNGSIIGEKYSLIK
jgi:hypothetical protein